MIIEYCDENDENGCQNEGEKVRQDEQIGRSRRIRGVESEGEYLDEKDENDKGEANKGEKVRYEEHVGEQNARK